ncbi:MULTISPECIES: hypothetical protein [Lactobacillaceae]|uniref:hypothetical protein n=1 Tax=Lactobacillaceae TaxID=33958 RepID=UPI001292263E|nr:MULTISPECIES: hypothetical protein [Lactobacillaceae]MBU7459487.1 hypothetical protein [Lactiplantibacillus plantarum]MBU7495219.1 hypothetical protein [Lactiplantibacillus pentosus]MBU7521192.1 hypothetical protein [Lactiplantibacillus pentosus]
MTELERIAKLEKKLKVRKRKALAKKYEKLGRDFYKVDTVAKSFKLKFIIAGRYNEQLKKMKKILNM